MDRAGRQGMMCGAAQEAELHLKQAIAALNTTPEVWAGHSRQTGDTAFHYDRNVGVARSLCEGNPARVLEKFSIEVS